MNCRICNERIIIEDNSVWALNPVSFRYATMHIDCLRNAYEDLKGSLVAGFTDKQDKYNSLVNAVCVYHNGDCKRII